MNTGPAKSLVAHKGDVAGVVEELVHGVQDTRGSDGGGVYSAINVSNDVEAHRAQD